MYVSIYAAGDYEQAMGIELVLPSHGTAELDYAATPNPDVADLAVARSDNCPAPDDEVEARRSHPRILAHRGWGSSGIG
jgi:hypothetical protein